MKRFMCETPQRIHAEFVAGDAACTPTTTPTPAKNCYELLLAGVITDGLYQIRPTGTQLITAYCQVRSLWKVYWSWVEVGVHHHHREGSLCGSTPAQRRVTRSMCSANCNRNAPMGSVGG